jgi:hypothetical protein
MSRNARTRTPRGRRIALSCGTAVGAAVIAASFSMGNAPAAHADVIGADAVSDLIGAADPAQALSAAGVPEADALGSGPPAEPPALSDLIAAFDPHAFTGGTPGVNPTDLFGLLGYYTDTYLLGPTHIDALIYPFVEDIIAKLPSGAASVDVDPVSDLFGALDPSAFSAGVADLTAPTAADALGPVIDGLLGSGLSLF